MYEHLVTRWGPAVGVESARGRWSAIVQAATAGTVGLITRERWEWAAVVPLSEIATPLVPDVRSWTLTEARSQLGALVREVHTEDAVILLTRHRRPIAALIGARRLAGRPDMADRLLAQDLLQQGLHIVLGYHPGEPCCNDPDNPDPGVDPAYLATALTDDGTQVATGAGPTLTEALSCMIPARQFTIADTDAPLTGGDPFEPPF
jgi:prevent-host-death family protein